MRKILTLGVTLFSILTQLYAQTGELYQVSSPHSHAPIGVMGDHMHSKGEFMLSYRFMHMGMGDSRIGTDNILPNEIVTSEPNYFAGMPMMPPTLRVVPINMDMEMHMFGIMYAPADWITLMGMMRLVSNQMDHITYEGGSGTTQLNQFTTKSNGIGDTRITALIRLVNSGSNKMHLNAGLSLPTGSITEEDDVLTPMDTQPTLRLPYPMQIGSGTFDLVPGITYNGTNDRLGWGSQLNAYVRLGENDEGYKLGNYGQLTAWSSYQLAPWISSSLRLIGSSRGKIGGQDSNIVVPVQTADPTRQGGKRLDVSFGVNLIGQTGFIRNHRLATEIAIPTYQNLNGPQLETDWILTLGWQYAIN